MRVLVLSVLSVLPVTAQTQAFEVATLKSAPPPKSNEIVINLGRWQTGRFTMGNVTLGDMMKFAYSLSSNAQLEVPDWAGQARFDIEAKAPAATGDADRRLMLRTLLDERLHVKLRREQRVLPYLALVKGKLEPKIMRTEEVPDSKFGPQLPGRIAHPQMSMQGLATLLSRFERQTVVDQTGLEGVYKVNLEWAPENFSAQPDPNAPPPDRPSLFTAVNDQLGLKLESRKGPLQVLVVESASRVPEEN